MSAPIDPQKTVLLLLDLQVGFLARLPSEASSSVLANAASALTTARQHGTQIAFIRAALHEEDLASVPSHNKAFAAMKTAEMAPMIHPDHAATQIHASLIRQPGDFVYRKIRFGTFMREPSMGLLEDFKKNGVETVVLGGVVTSGAVLSAVRQLADLDFRLVVLSDCCADYDEEVQRVLMEKVFPRQATVVKSEELEGLFK